MKYELVQKQSLSLKIKIEMSKRRIREFYEHFKGEVYVSFSGGKDSTVLLDLVRSIYPEVLAVFVDTGLEYPEIKEFVRSTKNVMTIRPEKSFLKVIEEEGYPVVSKKISKMIRVVRNPTDRNEQSRKLYLTGIRSDGQITKSGWKISKKWKHLLDAPFKISEKCCDILKKNPIRKFERKRGLKSFIGTMASDNKWREAVYLGSRCNSFGKYAKSRPLSFWMEKDIWDYIKKFKLKYSTIYDSGLDRTGCMYCLFGLHMEKGKNRFERMKETHPTIYKYCMNRLGLKGIIDYVNKVN